MKNHFTPSKCGFKTLSGLFCVILLCSFYSLRAQVGAMDSAYIGGMGFIGNVMGGVLLQDSLVLVYGNFTRCNESCFAEPGRQQ